MSARDWNTTIFEPGQKFSVKWTSKSRVLLEVLVVTQDDIRWKYISHDLNIPRMAFRAISLCKDENVTPLDKFRDFMQKHAARLPNEKKQLTIQRKGKKIRKARGPFDKLQERKLKILNEIAKLESKESKEITS